VTKPPASTSLVTGVGTSFNAEWRAHLVPQFIDNLVAVHAHPWRDAELPHFGAPEEYPRQAALWQVNWWARVWRDDMVDPYPLITLAELWMRDRLPEVAAEDLVLLHGDFRTGNFMFDADSGRSRAGSQPCSTGSWRTSATSTRTWAGSCSGCSPARPRTVRCWCAACSPGRS
jgi:aminoglycoside phosphotransferase (APT) family kinase protein